jgi:hypothetical protein
MNIWCLLFDHSWLKSGWCGSVFDEKIPQNHIRSYKRCRRCGAQDHFDEPLASVQTRFDGYREKYGDAYVQTDEFKVPWTEDTGRNRVKNISFAEILASWKEV